MRFPDTTCNCKKRKSPVDRGFSSGFCNVVKLREMLLQILNLLPHLLNQQLEIFHRLARKYRTQPDELHTEYATWQQELEQLQQLDDPETLAEQVKQTEQEFLALAEQLDQQRRDAAGPLAKLLTEQVKPLAYPKPILNLSLNL